LFKSGIGLVVPIRPKEQKTATPAIPTLISFHSFRFDWQEKGRKKSKINSSLPNWDWI